MIENYKINYPCTDYSDKHRFLRQSVQSVRVIGEPLRFEKSYTEFVSRTKKRSCIMIDEMLFTDEQIMTSQNNRKHNWVASDVKKKSILIDNSKRLN